MNELQNNRINPLLSLWLHPKKTARFVLQQKSMIYTIVFLSIGSIGSLSTALMDTEIYPLLPIWIIMLLLLILSPIIDIISNALYSLGIWLCGKMFAGIATYKDTFQAMTLVSFPYIVLIPFYFAWMIFDPSSLFIPDTGGFLFPILVGILTIAISIWSMVISIAVIAEAHQFSHWKSFFTLLIISIIFIIILVVIAIIITFIFMIIGMSFV